MIKMKAPKDCPGISFGATWFPAKNGIVELPDEYVSTAKQNGFTVAEDERKRNREDSSL